MAAGTIEMTVDIGIAAAARAGYLTIMPCEVFVSPAGNRSQTSLPPHRPLLSPAAIRTNDINVTLMLL